MLEFSVVLPVHDEERMLGYSLPSVYELKPSEVVLLFDRCSDGSVDVAKDISGKCGMSGVTRFVVVEESSDFRMRFAFLRCLGVQLARFPVVLVTGADLVLDRNIKDLLVYLRGGVKMVNFAYVDFPVNWRNLVKRLLTVVLGRVKNERWMSGVHAFFKDAMFECEDLDELKLVEAAQDTHLHKAIQKKYVCLYFRTSTVHLRPKEDGVRHFLRGRLYWRVARRGFLVTVLSALVTLRLRLIEGYIKERFGS